MKNNDSNNDPNTYENFSMLVARSGLPNSHSNIKCDWIWILSKGHSSNYILEFPEEHSMGIIAFVVTEVLNILSMTEICLKMHFVENGAGKLVDKPMINSNDATPKSKNRIESYW